MKLKPSWVEPKPYLHASNRQFTPEEKEWHKIQAALARAQRKFATGESLRALAFSAVGVSRDPQSVGNHRKQDVR